MKNFKKILALVVAMVMIIGTMSIGVSAESAYDSQIKITGLTSGDTVQFYQVLEWKESASDYQGWSLTSDFAAFKDNFTGADDAAKRTAAVQALIDGISSEEAGWLAKLAPATGKTGTMNGSEATLAIDGTNATQGLYMALVTPTDQKTVYNPVFVSSDYNKTNSSALWNVTSDGTYSDTGAAKKSTVTIDKQAEKDAGTTFDQTWTSTRIGEIVHYTVTTTIPGYGKVYTNPVFKVSDKLSSLELTEKPVITAPANAVATIDGDVGDTEYTITFDPDYLLTIAAPTTVTITYAAKVTTDAPMNINEEKNEVWVEYSHNPKNESDVNVEKDDTVHYTYTIDANILGGYEEGIQKSGSEIVKIGVDSNNQPIMSEKTWKSDVTTTNEWKGALEGAKFKLYTNAECSTEYTTVAGETFDIRSDANGRLYTYVEGGDNIPGIAGLDAGDYWLREEEAPAGFIKQTEAVKISIVPHFSEETVTEYFDGTEWHAEDDASADPRWKSATYKVDTLDSYEIKINDTTQTQHTFLNKGKTAIKVSDTGTVEKPSPFTNTKGVELPSTGGIGTTLFYVIGAILVLGAGILLVTKRRVSAN